MSQAYIPRALRQRVAESARHRCGYCLTPERVVGTPMQIDHIVPEALGGPTREENLWLACPLCNSFKGARVAALDPVTGETVRLFNPRTQSWPEHFTWEGNGTLIIGLTPAGRATVIAHRLNRASLIKARQLWVEAGCHPTEE